MFFPVGLVQSALAAEKRCRVVKGERFPYISLCGKGFHEG